MKTDPHCTLYSIFLLLGRLWKTILHHFLTSVCLLPLRRDVIITRRNCFCSTPMKQPQINYNDNIKNSTVILPCLKPGDLKSYLDTSLYHWSVTSSPKSNTVKDWHMLTQNSIRCDRLYVNCILLDNTVTAEAIHHMDENLWECISVPFTGIHMQPRP